MMGYVGSRTGLDRSSPDILENDIPERNSGQPWKGRRMPLRFAPVFSEMIPQATDVDGTLGPGGGEFNHLPLNDAEPDQP